MKTYNLTLILSDERGTTKVVLTVDAAHMNSHNVNPIFSALAQLHEHTMPAEKPPAEEGASR